MIVTPLIRFTLFWTVGLVMAQSFEPPWSMLLLGMGVAALASYLYRDVATAGQTAWAIIAIGCGMSRFLLAQPIIDEAHVAFYNQQTVELVGIIQHEPDERDGYTNLYLTVERLTVDNQPHAVQGVVLVRAARYPAWAYGDRLQLRGRLETPPIFADFSYRDYLARQGVHSLMRRPRIDRLADHQGHPFWATLFTFKRHAAATINQILAEPYAALLNGILLGIETNIPRELYEQFNRTGTSHIIVISGSNISFIAGLLLLTGQRIFGRAYAPPIAIIGIVIYTLLVGADSAVSRAAVMGSMWVLAIWVGRPGAALNALFASGLLLTLIDPLTLGDVGFQLSFMATLGLIVLVPPLQQRFVRQLRRLLNKNELGLTMAVLNDLLIITLAAQLITAPLMMYHFGQLSLVSLITNLLILSAQPFVMTLGGLATLAGLVWLPLGNVCGWLVWLPLAWTVTIVEWTASWPYAVLDLGRLPGWLVLLLYACLAAGTWRAVSSDGQPLPQFSLPPLTSLKTRLLIGGGSALTVLLGFGLSTLPDGKLHVAFLDVGQGDAILITLPGGKQILVDGGPSPTQLNWRLGQTMPFWDHSLDMVINTHPDADHLAGLIALPDRYEIEQVFSSGTVGRSNLYRQWQAELNEHHLVEMVGEQGMQLNLGDGVLATVFNPGQASRGFDQPNNQSLVLHVQLGQVSFLLSGDIEAEIERALVAAKLPLAATVLKSPHHGSNSSSSKLFLEAVAPQLIVIQVGAENRFGHPAAEVLERYTTQGATVLRNDHHGTIELITDGERLWVEVEHGYLDE